MKNNQSFSIMASAIAILFCAIGCNAPTKEAEAKQEAPKAVEAVVPVAFVPFKVMSVTQNVSARQSFAFKVCSSILRMNSHIL